MLALNLSIKYTGDMNIMNLFRRKPEPLPPPRSVTAQYTLNTQEYDKFLGLFRQHQKDALNSLVDVKVGQISLPTGTGKTYVQMAVHLNDMIEKTKIGKTGVYVISAHRLILCSQLLSQFMYVASKIGVDYDVLKVNSERFNVDDVILKLKDKQDAPDNFFALNRHRISGSQTTNSEEVKEAYNNAVKNKRHLLIVCTYHSFDRMSKLPKIDIITYDEAHIIGEEFKDNVNKVKHLIDREYFFTATRKVSGHNEGMNNTEFYGEILHSESPRTMIDRGEIVRPAIHAIRLPNEARGDFQNTSMVIQSIGEGFVHHHKLIKENSKFPDKIGAKVVVAVSGNDDLTDIITNQAFKLWANNNSIEIFSFSSANGYTHNFESVGRMEAFDRMQSLPDEQNAILIHIDILSEGIDIPSITGCMPLRNMSNIKLAQFIGRAGRLHPFDRQRLYDNIIKPDQFDEFVKPHYYVIFPEFLIVAETNRMERFIGEMLNTYELMPFDIPLIDEFYSSPDEVLPKITDADSTNNRDDVSKLEHILRDIMKEQIAIALNDSSDEEILDYLEGIGNA
jgi:superfamily II DNA or RNA helicase